MSLHGTIEINGSVIGAWSARRIIGSTDRDAVNTYDCEVAADQMGGGVLHVDRFHLQHRYGDGAVALAAKVLARANLSDDDAR